MKADRFSTGKKNLSNILLQRPPCLMCCKRARYLHNAASSSYLKYNTIKQHSFLQLAFFFFFTKQKLGERGECQGNTDSFLLCAPPMSPFTQLKQILTEWQTIAEIMLEVWRNLRTNFTSNIFLKIRYKYSADEGEKKEACRSSPFPKQSQEGSCQMAFSC